MTTISVKNLRLKSIIGIYPKERTKKQDVIINYSLDFDSKKAKKSDEIKDTIDYKKINKEIISLVEKSDYFLLEKLTDEVIKIIKKNPKVIHAEVEVDKLGALRFADSVSVKLSYDRQNRP